MNGANRTLDAVEIDIAKACYRCGRLANAISCGNRSAQTFSETENASLGLAQLLRERRVVLAAQEEPHE